MPVGQYIISNNVDSLSWSTARAKAQALGGDLASLSSQTEIDIIEVAFFHSDDFWSDAGGLFGTDLAGGWIGLSRDVVVSEIHNGWQWLDGNGFDPSGWVDHNSEPGGDIKFDNFASIFDDRYGFGWANFANEPTARGQVPVYSYVTELNASVASLSGTAGIDHIIGGAIANVIDGGAGADYLQGGAGDDVYYVDNPSDAVLEDPASGRDSIATTVSYTLNNSQEVENLSARFKDSLAALRLTGNSFDNLIDGSAGGDTLDGSTGADTMSGFNGNDTYLVEHAGDLIVEAAGQGTDLVQSGISRTLEANVENLTLTGASDVNGTGNGLANALVGNAGKNLLDGQGGADRMSGGAGDDVYVVDHKGDRVVEISDATSGTDTVRATVSHALAKNVEKLVLEGTKAIDGTGNTLANTITGNGAANVLEGGKGADLLKGKGGGDTFVFDTSLKASNIDRIDDFAREDTIRLDDSVFKALSRGKLEKSAFKDVRDDDVDSSDRILYDSKTGELYYDKDGSGGAKALQFATLDKQTDIAAADFFVV